MARTYTLLELRTRVRRRADVGDFITDAEIDDYINESYADLFTMLVAAGENYDVSETTISISSATDTYSLPVDFYKIIGVDYKVTSTDQYITLFPFNENERNRTISGASSLPTGTIRVRYATIPDKLTSDSDTVDGIAGWEKYVILDAAIACKDKQEMSTSTLMAQKREMQKKIEEKAMMRDIGTPATITDITKSKAPIQATPLRYRLEGNSIRFVYMDADYLVDPWSV